MNGCRAAAPDHRFDPVSGWCLNNCGHRADGRIVVNGDEKYPGPSYTPEQLHQILTKDRT